MDTNDTIGARIRFARRAAGLMQIPLSKLVGVDQTTISKWERSDGPEPRADQVVRLARALSCDLAWLMTGEGTPPAVNTPLDPTGTEG